VLPLRPFFNAFLGQLRGELDFLVGSRCRVGVDTTCHDVRQCQRDLDEHLEGEKLKEVLGVVGQHLSNGSVEPDVFVDAILEGAVVCPLGEPDDTGADTLVGFPEENDGGDLIGTGDFDVCDGVGVMPQSEVGKEDAEEVVCK